MSFRASINILFPKTQKCYVQEFIRCAQLKYKSALLMHFN